MHVISRDFDSEFLKTKKHWNSFTTAFFLRVDDVLATLSQGGNMHHLKVREVGCSDAGYGAWLTEPLL